MMFLTWSYAARSKTTYEPGRGWRFEYDHITEVDSLKIFLRDLRGVTRMTTVGNGLETSTYLPTLNLVISAFDNFSYMTSVFGNPTQYEHLIRYFELVQFTPSQLTMRFDEVSLFYLLYFRFP